MILFIVMAVFLVMSWIVEASIYNSGVYASVGYYRAGIFDIFALILSAFYYKRYELFYIFVVGGCYGVLQQTRMYRKLVDQVSSFIRGKEAIAMAVVTLVMGIIISISNNLFVLFFLVPFIVSIFLRNGYDKITALSAGFGGMFIGYLGLTLGTCESLYLYESTGVEIMDWIWVKVAMFVAAYVLFNLFAILHMKKDNQAEEADEDLFCPAVLDESKLKKKRKVKVWPLVVIACVVFVNLVLGYISWADSFGVTFFTDLHTKFTSAFQIADVPVFSSLLGSYFTGFGEWDSLLFASFFMIVAIFIVACISKMSVGDFVNYFSRGLKKISKVAFIFGLSYIVVFLATSFPWQNTMIHGLFGEEKFNIFLLFIIAFITQIFIGDPSYSGYMFAPYLATAFASNIIATTLLWRLGSGLALVVGPTSFILFTALTYMNISYKDWLKYIWKFAFSFFVVSLLILAVVIYV